MNDLYIDKYQHSFNGTKGYLKMNYMQNGSQPARGGGRGGAPPGRGGAPRGAPAPRAR
jgi:hypothetical protein